MNARAKTPLAERLERHYVPEPNSGCWLWLSSVTGPGYGQISDPARRGRPLLAHRVSYELHVGAVPDGLDLDHLCRVRSCVNPRHLEPVSRRENLRRGATLTAKNIAATHCPRGHSYTEENTLRTNRGARSCRECNRLACKARNANHKE